MRGKKNSKQRNFICKNNGRSSKRLRKSRKHLKNLSRGRALIGYLKASFFLQPEQAQAQAQVIRSLKKTPMVKNSKKTRKEAKTKIPKFCEFQCAN